MNIEITKQIDLSKNDAISSVFGGLYAQQHQDAYKSFYSLIRNVSPSRILEIGTAKGGLTQFLKLCLDDLKLESRIRSYDVKNRKQYKDMRDMGIDVRVENIFNENFSSCDQGVIQYIQQLGTTIVLCDGGNKIEEFKLLSKYIKSGDIILAHDYAESNELFDLKIKTIRWNWCEITNDDILESANINGLEHYMKDEFENVVWTCRRKV